MRYKTFFPFVVLLLTNISFGQELIKENVFFSVNKEEKTFFIKVNELDDSKTNIEIQVNCFIDILDYKKITHRVNVLNIHQKINTNRKVLFGGELIEGEYVITMTYVENGKTKKIIEKKVIKNLDN